MPSATCTLTHALTHPTAHCLSPTLTLCTGIKGRTRYARLQPIGTLTVHRLALMMALAAVQPGFLGVECAREAGGFGITVSYWRDDSSARAWKAVVEHLEAQRRGREEWYAEYDVIVAEVIRAYGRPR